MIPAESQDNKVWRGKVCDVTLIDVLTESHGGSNLQRLPLSSKELGKATGHGNLRDYLRTRYQ